MKVNITIPTSLNEVTLKQYQKYNKVVEENPEAYDFQNLKLVEIFCGLKLKDVNDINLSDFEDIITLISQAFEKKRKFILRFTHNDIPYGFEPDLENIKMGAYVDLSTYLGDVNEMHKAMSVLYRPIIKTKGDMYLIEDYKGSNDDLINMPLDIALEAQVFFYNLGKELLKDTLVYLKTDKKLMKNKKTKELLEKAQDGMIQSLHSLGEISLN